jgi:hypothetical protein
LYIPLVLSLCKGSGLGCQMVCFQTKNPNLDKFWRVLLWKIIVYFITIWSILRPLEKFYGHLVYFVVSWYIFPSFGILDQDKSGTPGSGEIKSCTLVVSRFSAIKESRNLPISIFKIFSYRLLSSKSRVF